MSTELVAIVSASIASGIAGIFALVTIGMQRRADERRQIRELAVQVALENWKIYKGAADVHGGSVSPLDTYLIHAMHLVAALDGSLKTPDQIREHLRAGFSASKAADEEVDAHNEKLKAERAAKQKRAG